MPLVIYRNDFFIFVGNYEPWRMHWTTMDFFFILFFFNLEECLDFFIVFNGIFCFHIYDEKHFDLPFRCKKANSTICLPNPCIPGLIHNPISIQCRLSESCWKIEIIWKKKTFVRACTWSTYCPALACLVSYWASVGDTKIAD